MTDLGYHIASIAARRLPVWVTDRMAAWIADVYVSTHPSRAREASHRVGRAWRAAGLGGPPPPARETFRAFAWALRDFLAARGGGARVPAVRLDAEAARHLAAARATGAPTVVVSGHFGPWEMALWWLAREVGPMEAISAPHRLEAVERFFRARRAAFGVRTLGGERPAAEALRRLRGGGWVAALADRSWAPGAGRSRRDRWTAASEPEDGHGAAGERLVAIDTAPLRLARRARAQVLPGAAWRDSDGQIAVRFHAPFTLDPDRGGLSVEDAAASLSRFFDDHVRAHPTQWFDWSIRSARTGTGRAR
jgi:lauroyl/myristoyl acyltransferase